MKKLFLYYLLAGMTLFSCSKKDELINESEEIEEYNITSPEGSWFVLKGPNGSEEILSGNSVYYSGGQLIDQAFYRNINVFTPKGSFNFRVSFPKEMIGKADNSWFSEHLLNTTRLPLEETKYMKSIYPELNFSSSQTFSEKNASGSVKLKNYFKYKKDEFSLFGEVYIKVEGKDKNTYEIKGYFWKE